ncbi:hypothetical protein KUTeg_006363 [Tegillarca granosa]|uniref:Down syndrome cell adhesion molecule n=1 Tax=Tegillarca granosa TaxID=220873 RepID=A0ABQ9FGD2_TEGGR|nr:hypothetical protein KUTeg_006363 [Tegillarca granosa]
MLRRVLVLTGFYVTLTLDLIELVQGRTTESPLDRLQGPIFISEPPSSLAFANSKGSLVPCTAFGRPAPVLDWVRSDGSSVESIYNILEILPNNTLYFHPFEQEKFMINVHDQTYRCTASNEAGSVISRSMSVKAVLVEQYRSYNLQLSDVWAQISGTAIFRCVINPVFAKEYIKVVRWTQGTKRIKGDRVSILSDGELHIRDIRAEDRFTPYACVAKNILTGEEKSSDVAYLHTHEAPAALSSPKIIDTADSITVEEGGNAELPCVGTSNPLPTYRWLKDGKIVHIDNYHYKQNGGNLLVLSARVSDSGYYICNISNKLASLVARIDPPSQVVDSGQSASFNCSVSGHPIKSIKWFKNGQQIQKSDPHYYIQSETLLQIDEINRQDQGMYQCIISNDGDNSQATSQLLIGAAHPTFIDKFVDQYVQTGQRTSLRCSATGTPTPNITWTLDDGPIPDDPNIRVGSTVSILGDVVSYVNISSIKIVLGGEYKCLVVNEVGYIEHKGRVNVYDGYTLPQNHLQKVINGTLTIEKVQKLHDTGEYVCIARNSDDQGMSRSVFIKPPVIDSFHFPRKKQGDRIVVSCVKLGTFTSMLVIGDASPRHNGNYTCLASNAAASINYTSPLHVDVPPRWVIEPSDQYVVLKKGVSLDCLTAGTPEPQITWKKARGNRPGNYRLIEYVSSDDETSTDHLQKLSNGTLVIHNAVESDHGYYLCHSTNGVGLGLSKVIFLTVHIPARFDAPSKNYTIRKGKNLTMDCQAIGDKPLSVSWSFNAQSLTPRQSNRREISTVITNRGKLSQLSLRPSTREDTGFYVCTAKNKFGVGVLPMRLTVLGVWQGVLPNITVTSSKLKATITKLHPSYVYHVRVIANNSIGYSRPSVVLEVRMDEESPSGPPENVKVKAIGSEKLKIVWMPPKPESRNGLIKGYYIGYKETKSPYSFIYEPKVVDGKFTPELTIEKLKKFTEYTVHVQAYNDQGRGPSSKDTTVYTLEDVPSQPPKGVQASSINSQSIKVLWSPPPRFTLHGILQGYKIIYKPVRHDEDESDADTVTTNELGWTLTGLAKFTNYSLQVLAYTRKGEGVRSSPIYVRTMQDKPERPADIKALPVNSSSILVAWKSPLHKNGILTKYSLYYQNSSKDSLEIKLEIPSSYSNHRFVNLSVHMEYSWSQDCQFFRSYDGTMATYSKTPLFSCRKPHTISHMDSQTRDRIKLMNNGSLHIEAIVGSDAANYTCRATNIYGSDEITFAVSVQEHSVEIDVYSVLYLLFMYFLFFSVFLYDLYRMFKLFLL